MIRQKAHKKSDGQNCSTLTGCFKKTGYIHMVEYFVAIKNEGFSITWGNLITLKMSAKESICSHKS